VPSARCASPIVQSIITHPSPGESSGVFALQVLNCLVPQSHLLTFTSRVGQISRRAPFQLDGIQGVSGAVVSRGNPPARLGWPSYRSSPRVVKRTSIGGDHTKGSVQLRLPEASKRKSGIPASDLSIMVPSVQNLGYLSKSFHSITRCPQGRRRRFSSLYFAARPVQPFIAPLSVWHSSAACRWFPNSGRGVR